MPIDEFISSLLNYHKEGKIAEWLKKYILSSFQVNSIDEIKERKEGLQAQLEVIKSNIKDYENLKILDKLTIAREDKEQAEIRYTEYISFKESLLKDLAAVTEVFEKLMEGTKLEQIKQFYGDILQELKNAYENNDDLTIAQERKDSSSAQTLEQKMEETLSVMNLTVKTHEHNIEKMDTLIGKLEECFSEIDNLEV